jgi:hypothetical protein
MRPLQCFFLACRRINHKENFTSFKELDKKTRSKINKPQKKCWKLCVGLLRNGERPFQSNNGIIYRAVAREPHGAD